MCSMELEPVNTPMPPVTDPRPRVFPPLPVRLVAVDDVRLPAPAGAEKDLDAFYVLLLGFERHDEAEIVYRADNFLLRFDVQEPPLTHDSLRPIGIEVMSLAETEQKLIELEIDYGRQRGVTPGNDTLLLRDPAGNWLELMESREVR